MVRQAHHERVNYSGRAVIGVRRGRLARWLAEENPPFALSLSKGLTAWFDELTTNGSITLAARLSGSGAAGLPVCSLKKIPRSP